ncbi:MAG: glycosyltransferase [Candidatus Hydrogenedentes bacterium]|nr:glycosyltransferase [Candidatus Hydrogenedentota bacterium]
MRLALVKGDRLNPWHVLAWQRLRRQPDVTAFRTAVSGPAQAGDARTLRFPLEYLPFDTEDGPLISRSRHRIEERLFERPPRIVPFHERLREFDLIHTWELYADWTAEALAARARYGRPVTVTVWDTIPLRFEVSEERRRQKAVAARQADLIVVPTESGRRIWQQEGIDPSRIALLPPAVDVKRFAPRSVDRGRFGLAQRDFVLLFPGWVLPRKGIDYLLLALRELLHATPGRRPVRLLIAGEGPGAERARTLARDLKLDHYCAFTGAVPYALMPTVYNCADVLVLPDVVTPEWQEPLGMFALEGMACGRAAVSMSGGSLGELAGDAALKCPPNDGVALYESLHGRMRRDTMLRQQGDRAREAVVQRYSMGRFVTALANLYEVLLNPRRARKLG